MNWKECERKWPRPDYTHFLGIFSEVCHRFPQFLSGLRKSTTHLMQNVWIAGWIFERKPVELATGLTDTWSITLARNVGERMFSWCVIKWGENTLFFGLPYFYWPAQKQREDSYVTSCRIGKKWSHRNTWFDCRKWKWKNVSYTWSVSIH